MAWNIPNVKPRPSEAERARVCRLLEEQRKAEKAIREQWKRDAEKRD
jgi:hypothetical protein